jgi:hunchback-like protein
MVLNPDGTPNPEPIIDIYGTRRGPKQRPRNTVKSMSKENNNDIPLPYHAPPHLPIFQPSYQVIPQQPTNHALTYPYGCIMPNAFTANNNNNNSLLPKLPQSGNTCTREKSTVVSDLRRNSPKEDSKHFLATTSQYSHVSNTNNNNKNNDSVSSDLKMRASEVFIEEQNSAKRNDAGTGKDVMSSDGKEVEGDPLDLSKPEAMDISSEAVCYVTPSILHKSTTTKTSKHRRKGQAYKLEHISWKLQQSNVSENGAVNRNHSHMSESEQKPPAEKTDNLINTQYAEENDTQRKQHPQSELMETNEDLPKIEEESSSTHANNSFSADNPEVYRCPHCDIIFNDFVLYSIHKGYHGFQDPFTCNMCGVKTADRVDFFLHIGRSSHS